MPISAAKDLKRLLEMNKISGFGLENPDHRNMFTSQLQRFSHDRLLKGTTILDSGVKRGLNSKDRAYIDFILESGLADGEFNYIDIVGTIQQVAANPELSKALGGVRVGQSSSAYVMRGKFNLHRYGATNEFIDAMETTAQQFGMKGSDLARKLFIQYKSHVEPYIVDTKGNGIFNVQAIAEVTPAQLFRLVTKLDQIEVSDRRVDHDQLIETVQRIRNHSEYTDTERNF